MSDETTTKSGFVGIVGPANAGKSTLLNALLGTKLSIVSRKPQTTRERISGVLTEGDTQIVFVDTPGFVTDAGGAALTRYLQQNIEEAAADLDAVVLVLDAPHCVTKRGYLPAVLKALFGRLATPEIIVLNKVDQLEKERLLPLILQIVEQFKECSPEIIPLSALKDDGVVELKQLLQKRMPESPFMYPEDVMSDRQPDFILQEVVREKIFDLLHEELPYSAAVLVESLERQNDVVHIGATIFVEKESQKGIVVGKGGSKIKAIGTAARIELEEMLGEKVCLKLRASVEADWTRTVRGMQKVGYGRVD